VSLQYVAVSCIALQCVSSSEFSATTYIVFCSALQCVAVCCGVFHCVATVCCSKLQCVAVCDFLRIPPHSIVCCSVLQCVAVCCSVLQYFAVCCGVLQGAVAAFRSVL